MVFRSFHNYLCSPNLVSLLSTEKFSEMKDEIPQAVIDSHVKNAANARAEKAKQENSQENTGSLKTQDYTSRCQAYNRELLNS